MALSLQAYCKRFLRLQFLLQVPCKLCGKLLKACHITGSQSFSYKMQAILGSFLGISTLIVYLEVSNQYKSLPLQEALL